jgi:hypothetical protein
MIVKETKEPIFSITIPKNGNYNSLKRMAQEYVLKQNREP